MGATRAGHAMYGDDIRATCVQEAAGGGVEIPLNPDRSTCRITPAFVRAWHAQRIGSVRRICSCNPRCILKLAVEGMNRPAGMDGSA